MEWMYDESHSPSVLNSTLACINLSLENQQDISGKVSDQSRLHFFDDFDSFNKDFEGDPSVFLCRVDQSDFSAKIASLSDLQNKYNKSAFLILSQDLTPQLLSEMLSKIDVYLNHY